jgi:uncharacterized protein (DUF2147 family)
MRLITWLAVAQFALTGVAHAASTTTGLWWTEDRHGVVKISPCDEGLCGHLVGLIEPNDDKGQPKRDTHGNPECGLQIMHAHKADDPGEWEGIITDPRAGTDWNLHLTYNADGSLHLRGYVLLPLLGKSQEWMPFQGGVTKACAIQATSSK